MNTLIHQIIYIIISLLFIIIYLLYLFLLAIKWIGAENMQIIILKECPTSLDIQALKSKLKCNNTSNVHKYF